MDFLSKLFGKKDATKEEKEALDLFKKIVDEAAKEQAAKKPAPAQEQKPQQPAAKPAQEEYYDNEEDGPSGESYGPRMPAEENQFNFNGTYIEYFEKIFREDFPEYRVEKEKSRYSGKITIYTFYSGAKKVLVLELMSSSSESKKLRENCAKQGIPYLRYYYDYDGWWNTRAYVVRRTRQAIEG